MLSLMAQWRCYYCGHLHTYFNYYCLNCDKGYRVSGPIPIKKAA